nr:glucose-6-phosphate isomerase [Pelagibacterales bacterium]
MLTKNINFKKFGIKNNFYQKKINIKKLLKYYSEKKFIKSLSNNYNYSFDKSKIRKYKNFSNYNIIGMGGSSLGIAAIYSFLSFKIKKNFNFFNNISSNKNFFHKKGKTLNIVISKSGNTLETITNFNFLKNKKNNLFITEL